jgi:fumarate reductase subunit D
MTDARTRPAPLLPRIARQPGHRTSVLWRAALLHRLSGLALAAFLPLHFLTLGLAIDGEAQLEGFLRWSDVPAVKLGEGLLMFLLAVHAFGGLRVLAIENLPWRDGQRLAALASIGLAALLGFVFLAWLF